MISCETLLKAAGPVFLLACLLSLLGAILGHEMGVSGHPAVALLPKILGSPARNP